MADKDVVKALQDLIKDKSINELTEALTTLEEKLATDNELLKTFAALSENDFLPALSKQTKDILAVADSLGVEYDRLGDIQNSTRMYIKLLKQQGDLEAKHLVIAKKTIQQTEALRKVQNATASSLRNLLGIQEDFTKTWAGNLVKLGSASDGLTKGIKVGLVGAFDQLKKSVLSFAGVANLGVSMIDKVKESTTKMVLNMDTARASFFKTTGAAKDYKEELTAAWHNNMGFAVSLDEAAESFTALYTNLNRFTMQDRAARESLTDTTIRLSAAGIAATNTAKTMDFMIAGLQKTPEEAEAAAKSLFVLAQNLQMPPDVIASEFVASQSQLATWGDKSEQIFKAVAGQAKATSLSIGTLLKFSQQMDTFEGSANVAAKLNAMLGGDIVNSVELLNASEERRIEIVRESIDLAGVSWKEMGKYQKMAVANAAGITDLAEAQKFFGTSFSDFQKYSREAKTFADAEEKIKDASMRAAPFVKKLNTLFESFAVAVSPIVDVLQGIMNLLMSLVRAGDGMGGKIIGWVFGIAGGLAAIGGSMVLINKGKGIFSEMAKDGGAISKLIEAMKAAKGGGGAEQLDLFGDAKEAVSSKAKDLIMGGGDGVEAGPAKAKRTPSRITSFNSKFNQLSKGLEKGFNNVSWASIMKAAVILPILAIGIAAMAGALWIFKQAVGDDPKILLWFAGFLTAIGMFGVVMSSFAPVLMITAAGVGALGLALVVVGAAANIFAKAIVTLSKANYENIFKLGEALWSVTKSLGMFGISSLGTIGLSLSLRSITSAINDLDVSAANSLSNVFNSLTRIIELKSELSSLSAEFGHMAASINSVETPKAVAFSGAVGAGAGANNNQTAANSEPVQIVLKLNEHVLGTVIAQLNTRYAGTVNNSYYPNQVIGPTPTKVRTA